MRFLNRRGIACLAVILSLGMAIGVFGDDQTVSCTISPTDLGNTTGTRITLEPEETGRFIVTVNTPGGYILIGTTDGEPTYTNPNFIWVNTNIHTYLALNTAWTVGSTTVRVTARWKKIGGGGGGSETVIERWAEDTAEAKEGTALIVEVEPAIVPITQISVAYAYVLDPLGNRSAVNANWTVDDPAFIVGEEEGSSVSVQQNEAGESGVHATVGDRGTPSWHEGSNTVIFVGVDNLQYKIGSTSWAAMPDPLYVTNGTTVDFIAIKEPSGAASWPDGKPEWGGAASGQGESNSVTFASVGSNTVTIECGNIITGRVMALKVDIEQVETNVGWQVTNVVLNLSADSFWAESEGGSVSWASTPAGLGDVGYNNTNFWFNPSNSTPTTYVVRAWSSLLTNCFDTCTVTVLKVELTNMTFGMGWDIVPDTGGSYPTPHWSATNSSPYLYQRSSHINATATFKVEPATYTGNITLSGDGPDDLDFTNTTVAVSGGLATYPATDSTGTLTNYVDFWNPMQINWRYGIGGTAPAEAGQTSNRVYVSLAYPAAVPTLYHTVVHLACSVGHATNEPQAVSNSWSQLTGHNFTTWDGRTLFYYRDGAGWNSPGQVSQLLTTSNANCVAWRNLLRYGLAVNGVGSDRIYIAATGPTNEVFLVGDWTFGAASFSNTPPYNWRVQFGTNNVDMVPRPPGDVYGDLTSLATINGQNTAPPSEKVFGNHRMVRYGGIYYDPSYGVTHASISNLVDSAVDGYGFYQAGDPTSNFVLRVKTSTGVYEIGEVVNHPSDFSDGLP